MFGHEYYPRDTEDLAVAADVVLQRFKPSDLGNVNAEEMKAGRQLFANYLSWTAGAPLTESVESSPLERGDQNHVLLTFGYLLEKLIDECPQPMRWRIIVGSVLFAHALGRQEERHAAESSDDTEAGDSP